jgi:hypothetical protein
MPKLYFLEDGSALIHFTAGEQAEIEHGIDLSLLRSPAFDEVWRKVFNRKARTKNLPSRNKSLAPGKPSKRGAKGKPAKAGVKARKGTRKK